MSKYLPHLCVDHHYFISQDQLSLLLNTFAWSQWDVIPDKKLLKVVLYHNNFLIQWYQKGWWAALEDFRFAKYANLKHMVYHIWDRLNSILLRRVNIKFDEIKKLTFFLFMKNCCEGIMFKIKLNAFIWSNGNFIFHKIIGNIAV